MSSKNTYGPKETLAEHLESIAHRYPYPFPPARPRPPLKPYPGRPGVLWDPTRQVHMSQYQRRPKTPSE